MWASSAQQGAGWVPPEVAAAAAEHAQSHGSWTCSMCTLVNSPSAAACEACTASRPAPSSRPAGGSRPSSGGDGASASAGNSGVSGAAASQDGGVRKAQQQRSSHALGSRPSSAAATADDRAAELQLAQEALLRDARSAADAALAGPATDPDGKGGKGKQKKVPKFEKLRLTGGDASATHDWLETSGGTQKRNPQNAWGLASRPSTARSAAAKRDPPPPPAWGSTSTSQRDRLISEAWSKP